MPIYLSVANAQNHVSKLSNIQVAFKRTNYLSYWHYLRFDVLDVVAWHLLDDLEDPLEVVKLAPARLQMKSRLFRNFILKNQKLFMITRGGMAI